MQPWLRAVQVLTRNKMKREKGQDQGEAWESKRSQEGHHELLSRCCLGEHHFTEQDRQGPLSCTTSPQPDTDNAEKILLLGEAFHVSDMAKTNAQCILLLISRVHKEQPSREHLSADRSTGTHLQV